MSEAKPYLTQSTPMAPMDSPAPVHGAHYQAGPPSHYVEAGHPAQYAQGYQQPAPNIVRVVTQPSAPPRVYDNYRAEQSVVIGAIQITVGILSIILNIIIIMLEIEIDSYVQYILASSFAVVAAKKKTKCPVIANMVLSILSAVFVWNHISFAAVSVGLDASKRTRTVYNSDSYDYIGWHSYKNPYLYNDDQWSTIQASFALSCIMLIIGFVEFVVAVWSSTLACRVTCCGNTNRPQQYATPGPHVTYGQYPDQPLGAGVMYTGAPAQPIGPGVAY